MIDRFFLFIYFFYTVLFFFNFQIDAHVGSVNDLAFCYPNKKLSVITCGDDKTIKVGYENSSYLVSHRKMVICLQFFFLSL